MDCLVELIGTIYLSFCSKEFLSAAFVDVKGAHDAIHISTLINRLLDLHIPNHFCLFIQSFFSCHLYFFSPLEQIAIRTAYRGLPQGSCLSPILFNVYSLIISNKLIENGFSSLFCVDDIVIYLRHK